MFKPFRAFSRLSEERIHVLGVSFRVQGSAPERQRLVSPYRTQLLRVHTVKYVYFN